MNHTHLMPLIELADAAYERCREAPPHPACAHAHNASGHSVSVDQCNNCLRDWYFSHSNDSISYECARRRWAYVIRYLPTNACNTCRILAAEKAWWNTIISRARAEQELRIVSWGCGPGSDLLGALMWLPHVYSLLYFDDDARRVSAAVRLIAVDAQEAWIPVLKFVTTTAGRAYAPKNSYGEVTCCVDPTQATAHAIAAFRPHILISSWLWSEFSSDGEALGEWQEASASLAELGTPCLVVLVDRTEDRIVRRLHKLVSSTRAGYRELLRIDADSYSVPINFTARTAALLPRKTINSSFYLLLLNASQT